MRAPGGNVLWVGLLAALCLGLAACSSQQAAGDVSGAGGAGALDGGTPTGAGQPDGTGAPSACVVNCGLVQYTLTQRAPDSCTFFLAVVPPDPNNVAVKLGNTTIPESDTEGWAFEPGLMAITFTGSYCQAVLDGTLAGVRMLAGCTGCPVP